MIALLRTTVVPTLAGCGLLLIYFFVARVARVLGVTEAAGVPLRVPSSAEIGTGLALTVVSYALSMAAAYVLLTWAYERVPGRAPLAKGLCFGLLLLFLSRQFLVDHLVFTAFGEAVWASALEQVLTWVFLLAVAVVLALFVARQRTRESAGLTLLR